MHTITGLSAIILLLVSGGCDSGVNAVPPSLPPPAQLTGNLTYIEGSTEGGHFFVSVDIATDSTTRTDLSFFKEADDIVEIYTSYDGERFIAVTRSIDVRKVSVVDISNRSSREIESLRGFQGTNESEGFKWNSRGNLILASTRWDSIYQINVDMSSDGFGEPECVLCGEHDYDDTRLNYYRGWSWSEDEESIYVAAAYREPTSIFGPDSLHIYEFDLNTNTFVSKETRKGITAYYAEISRDGSRALFHINGSPDYYISYDRGAVVKPIPIPSDYDPGRVSPKRTTDIRWADYQGYFIYFRLLDNMPTEVNGTEAIGLIDSNSESLTWNEVSRGISNSTTTPSPVF